MPRFGLHATPSKRVAVIGSRGLKRQPFWKSMATWRNPKNFRFFFTPLANIVSGKSRREIVDAAYDALKAANIHITFSGRTRFKLEKLRMFLVDLDKADVKSSRQKLFAVRTGRSKKTRQYGETIDELGLECGPEALEEISLSPEEIRKIREETAEMDWLQANRFAAEIVAQKILKEIGK